MGVDERHQGQEAVVGDAEDADAAVALRDVLHQPVDRVVGVGRVIDGRRVLRPVQRAIHHVVALGAVLSAHVLDRADVAALDDDLGGVVVAVQARAQVRAVGAARERGGVVGRAREQDRRVPGALRHEDDGMQLHPVTHGDHHVALHVVEAVGGGGECRRRLARERGVLRRRGGLGPRRFRDHQGGQHRREPQQPANAVDRIHENSLEAHRETGERMEAG